MKKIKILSVAFALCIVLTGCEKNNAKAPVSPTVSSSESDPISSPDLLSSDNSSEAVSEAKSAVSPTISSSESDLISSPDLLSSGNSSEAVSEPLSRAECEQIVMLFKSWGDLNYNIHPDDTLTYNNYFPECVDASQFITEEVTPIGSIRTYTEYFYLVTSGDFATEKGFNRKLDEMFSEKFKKRYLGCSSAQEFRFKDGETYVASVSYIFDGTEPEKSLRLNIKSIDEKSVVLSVGDADYGQEYEYTSTLIRSENGGFKIDDTEGDGGGLFSIPQLFHYKNLEVVVYWQDNALYTITPRSFN